MQPTKILQPARLQRSGCIAVAILGLFSLTGGSCQSVFNSGPTIVDAEKLPSSINYNSTNLVESCTSIPSSRYTQILNWHITYSDNTTADKPIFWPKGNTSPQPVYVYINSSDETIYEQSKNALNIWNAALNANAHGSVQIAYQTVSDPSAANVEIYDTSPDSEGGGIVGSEGNEVLSPDYSQLVSAKVFIETGQGTFPTFQIAVHELGHALGLDHNYYLRSVMFPILDTTGCSLKDPVMIRYTVHLRRLEATKFGALAVCVQWIVMDSPLLHPAPHHLIKILEVPAHEECH
jgi:hypothetical protein